MRLIPASRSAHLMCFILLTLAVAVGSGVWVVERRAGEQRQRQMMSRMIADHEAFEVFQGEVDEKVRRQILRRRLTLAETEFWEFRSRLAAAMRGRVGSPPVH